MGRMTTHTLWKIENVPNHQPVYIYIYMLPPSQNPCFALFSEGCLKQP